MLRTVLKSAQPAFEWLDVVDPTAEELEEIAARYGIHPTSVQDCLDPEHLPKYERYGETTFIILRAYDEQADERSESVQELTRKVAVFFGDDFLITVHRKDQPYLTRLREDYAFVRAGGEAGEGQTAIWPQLLVDLTNAVISTYAKPLEYSEEQIHSFETSLFSTQRVTRLLRDIYHVKQRISTMKRMLWYTLNVVQQMKPVSAGSTPLYQDVRENAESWYLYSDELLEDANVLITLQLSIASHRTNEVVRVLTIFSVFFMPLTFIVGIYGMNFEYMPELKQRWGYPAVWGVMLAVTLTIFLWFRRRGWLR